MHILQLNRFRNNHRLLFHNQTAVNDEHDDGKMELNDYETLKTVSCHFESGMLFW